MANNTTPLVPPEVGNTPGAPLPPSPPVSSQPVIDNLTPPVPAAPAPVAPTPPEPPAPATLVAPQPVNTISAPPAPPVIAPTPPPPPAPKAEPDQEVQIKDEKTVDPDSVKPVATLPAASPAPPKKSSWLAWLIAVILMLILATLLYLWAYPTLFSNKEEEAVPTSSETTNSEDSTLATNTNLSSEISNLTTELNKIDEGIASTDDSTSDL